MLVTMALCVRVSPFTNRSRQYTFPDKKDAQWSASAGVD
jgi:hypothetical protein